MIPDSNNLISFQRHISVTVKYTLASWFNLGDIPSLQKYKGEEQSFRSKQGLIQLAPHQLKDNHSTLCLKNNWNVSYRGTMK